MIKEILAVGFGGFLGSICRYFVSIITKNVDCNLPLGTLIVNVLGCFFIGFFYAIANRYILFSNTLTLLLTTGFCGGFTTFSTFSRESLILIQNGNYFTFFAYILLSIILGIFAVAVGVWLGK